LRPRWLECLGGGISGDRNRLRGSERQGAFRQNDSWPAAGNQYTGQRSNQASARADTCSDASASRGADCSSDASGGAHCGDVPAYCGAARILRQLGLNRNALSVYQIQIGQLECEF
jgi:hypothetical protein